MKFFGNSKFVFGILFLSNFGILNKDSVWLGVGGLVGTGLVFGAVLAGTGLVFGAGGLSATGVGNDTGGLSAIGLE